MYKLAATIGIIVLLQANTFAQTDTTSNKQVGNSLLGSNKERSDRGVKVLGQEKDESVEVELKIGGIYFQLLEERAKPLNLRSEARIKELEGLMTVDKSNYAAFIDSIKRLYPESYMEAFRKSLFPNDLGILRRNLSTQIAVVQYFSTPNTLFIFIATHQNLKVKVIDVSQENLYHAVNFFYGQVSTKGELWSLQKNSEALYNIFIAPIENDLSGTRKISLIPSSLMLKVPFQALGTRDSEGKFNYLIEDFEVFYISDRTMLSNHDYTLSRDIDSVKILAFGNSDNTLPFAENEVENIAKIFTNVDVYVNSHASEEIAKERILDYTIVHFATHGYLDFNNSLNSNLTLAIGDSKQEDGRLTMAEILGIDFGLFQCELLILSACNSALEIKTNSSSMADIFLHLGAMSVVASLWSVDDRSTYELMNVFYRQLKAQNSKSGALQQAQISMINNPAFTHPYYWSAFKLIGEWR